MQLFLSGFLLGFLLGLAIFDDIGERKLNNYLKEEKKNDKKQKN